MLAYKILEEKKCHARIISNFASFMYSRDQRKHSSSTTLLVAQRQLLGLNHQILPEQLLLNALSVNRPFKNGPLDYQGNSGNSGNWERRTEEEVKTDQFIMALCSFTEAVSEFLEEGDRATDQANTLQAVFHLYSLWENLPL